MTHGKRIWVSPRKKVSTLNKSTFQSRDEYMAAPKVMVAKCLIQQCSLLLPKDNTSVGLTRVKAKQYIFNVYRQEEQMNKINQTNFHGYHVGKVTDKTM